MNDLVITIPGWMLFIPPAIWAGGVGWLVAYTVRSWVTTQPRYRIHDATPRWIASVVIFIVFWPIALPLAGIASARH